METPSKNRSWTLAVVSLATAMLMLDIAVVNTAITDMGRDLHTGLDGLKWVVDAYTLALAAVVLTTGSLADRPRPPPGVPARLAGFPINSGPGGPGPPNPKPENHPAGPGLGAPGGVAAAEGAA